LGSLSLSHRDHDRNFHDRTENHDDWRFARSLQFYFAPGNTELGLSTGGPTASSSNGGDGWQSSHWKHVIGCDPAYIGIMDPAIPSGCRRTITSSDTLALTTLGYNLTNNNPAATTASATSAGKRQFRECANIQWLFG
jgi:hypothetical protein